MSIRKDIEVETHAERLARLRAERPDCEAHGRRAVMWTQYEHGMCDLCIEAGLHKPGRTK